MVLEPSPEEQARQAWLDGEMTRCAMGALKAELGDLEVSYWISEVNGELVIDVPGLFGSIRVTALWLGPEDERAGWLVDYKISERGVWYLANRALLVGRYEEPGKAAGVVERLHSGVFTREILGAEEFERLFTRRDER